MRLLFLLALLSFDSIACQNYLPISEVRKAVAMEPNAGSKSCKELPKEECLCFDGVDWEVAKIEDEFANGAPIYTVNSQSTCKDEEECKLKMQELVCDEGFSAKYRLDEPQVFCERLDGHEQVNTGRKVLVSDAAKLAEKASREAQRELKRQIQKTKKVAAKKDLAEIDWATVTTIARCKQILKAIVDRLEESE